MCPLMQPLTSMHIYMFVYVSEYASKYKLNKFLCVCLCKFIKAFVFFRVLFMFPKVCFYCLHAVLLINEIKILFTSS